jgi:hypothetical protein
MKLYLILLLFYFGVIATISIENGIDVSKNGIDISNMPVSICGWPSLHEDGRFPPANTRQAQRFLSIALNQNIVADGIFNNLTTSQIEEFQEKNGIKATGYLNIDTWPQLVSVVTPTYFGSSGIAVEALQDSLNWNGFEVVTTGIFDEQTINATRAFQINRGADEKSGEIIDSQTWHLLITQCNSTGSHGYFWFDAGWPQGNITQSTLTCLKNAGFSYGIFQCWREQGEGTFWEECISNIENAWLSGYSSVGIYMYPNRQYDPTMQVLQLMGNLTENNVKFDIIMLDIEGTDWYNYTIESNKDFMISLKTALKNFNVSLSIYCGPLWEQYFGIDFTAFADVPLIYAHYDNVPSTYDWDYAPYGGWLKASGKQFFDGVSPEVLCNLPLDWDWSPTPFWVSK